MIGGLILRVAGDAALITDNGMIEVHLPPGLSSMATGAIAIEMAGRLVRRMATLAHAGRPPILTIGMAGCAFQFSMAAGQREKGMQCAQTASRESDHSRLLKLAGNDLQAAIQVAASNCSYWRTFRRQQGKDIPQPGGWVAQQGDQRTDFGLKRSEQIGGQPRRHNQRVQHLLRLTENTKQGATRKRLIFFRDIL